MAVFPVFALFKTGRDYFGSIARLSAGCGVCFLFHYIGGMVERNRKACKFSMAQDGEFAVVCRGVVRGVAEHLCYIALCDYIGDD